jgi:hypothetical protein
MSAQLKTKLREQSEWYNDGHGELHKQALDEIERLEEGQMSITLQQLRETLAAIARVWREEALRYRTAAEDLEDEEDAGEEIALNVESANKLEYCANTIVRLLSWTGDGPFDPGDENETDEQR